MEVEIVRMGVLRKLWWNVVDNGETCYMAIEISVASWSFVDFISSLGECQRIFWGRPVMA